MWRALLWLLPCFPHTPAQWGLAKGWPWRGRWVHGRGNEIQEGFLGLRGDVASGLLPSTREQCQVPLSISPTLGREAGDGGNLSPTGLQPCPIQGQVTSEG